MTDPTTETEAELDLENAETETETGAEAAAEAAPESPAAPVPAAKPAKARKAPRPRRGPPPEGVEEKRFTVILATSKLTDERGQQLRRGGAVSVPERRLEALLKAGKVRRGSATELETAERRHGLARLV